MITAFMFHDIRDNEDKRYEKRYKLKPFLTTSEFKTQLNFITQNYNVINSNQLSDFAPRVM